MTELKRETLQATEKLEATSRALMMATRGSQAADRRTSNPSARDGNSGLAGPSSGSYESRGNLIISPQAVQTAPSQSAKRLMPPPQKPSTGKQALNETTEFDTTAGGRKRKRKKNPKDVRRGSRKHKNKKRKGEQTMDTTANESMISSSGGEGDVSSMSVFSVVSSSQPPVKPGKNTRNLRRQDDANRIEDADRTRLNPAQGAGGLATGASRGGTERASSKGDQAQVSQVVALEDDDLNHTNPREVLTPSILEPAMKKIAAKLDKTETGKPGPSKAPVELNEKRGNRVEKETRSEHYLNDEVEDVGDHDQGDRLPLGNETFDFDVSTNVKTSTPKERVDEEVVSDIELDEDESQAEGTENVPRQESDIELDEEESQDEGTENLPRQESGSGRDQNAKVMPEAAAANDNDVLGISLQADLNVIEGDEPSGVQRPQESSSTSTEAGETAMRPSKSRSYNELPAEAQVQELLRARQRAKSQEKLQSQPMARKKTPVPADEKAKASKPLPTGTQQPMRKEIAKSTVDSGKPAVLSQGTSKETSGQTGDSGKAAVPSQGRSKETSGQKSSEIASKTATKGAGAGIKVPKVDKVPPKGKPWATMSNKKLAIRSIRMLPTKPARNEEEDEEEDSMDPARVAPDFLGLRCGGADGVEIFDTPNLDVASQTFDFGDDNGQSKKSKERLPPEVVDGMFSVLQDRCVDGPSLRRYEGKLAKDVIMDLFANLDVSTVRKHYAIGSRTDMKPLKNLMQLAKMAKVIFLTVETRTESGLISLMIPPNDHGVLCIDKEKGLNMETHGVLLRVLFYNHDIIKICRNAKETQRDLLALVVPGMQYEERNSFVSVFHYIRQLPQLINDRAMPLANRMEKMAENIEIAMGKGVKIVVRDELNAKTVGQARDRSYHKRFMRVTDRGVEIQRFSLNRFGSRSKGQEMTIAKGGRQVALNRPNGSRVLEEGQAQLGRDVEHLPYRHLWPVFAEKEHPEWLYCATILLDGPLRLLKLSVYAALCRYPGSGPDVEDIPSLCQVLTMMAKGLVTDIEMSNFKPDPFDEKRSSKEVMELQSYQVLGLRKTAKSWMGAESVPAYAIPFFPAPVFAQDIDSLTSGEAPSAEVVDLYFTLCLKWEAIHEDSPVVTQCAKVARTREVFGAAADYGRLGTKEERDKALRHGRDFFAEIWQVWPVAEWVFPIPIGVSDDVGRDSEPEAVILVVINFSNFIIGRTTQESMAMQPRGPEGQKLQVTVSLEETVEAPRMKPLSKAEKKSYLWYARDLVKSACAGADVEVVMADEDEEPKMPPVVVPPPKMAGNLTDLTVGSLLFVRNRAIARRSATAGEEGTEFINYVDFNKDFGGDDQLARALIFSEIMRQEPLYVDAARVEDLKRCLVHNKFFPAAIYPTTPCSLLWDVSKKIPDLQAGKYPAKPTVHVAKLRQTRVATLMNVVDVFEEMRKQKAEAEKKKAEAES